MWRPIPIIQVAALLAALAPPLAAQAHPELIVGCNGAGKLVVHFDDAKPYPLAASRFLGIEGYADAVPGFSSLLEAKPKNDVFPPDSKSNIVFIFEGADDGIVVWNDHGTGAMRPGETFQLGNPFFDSHPIWNIAAGTAPKPLAVRMRVRDTAGIHTESDVFAPRFLGEDGSQQYVCPMRCGGGPFSPKPGRCAICGMALKLLSGRAYKVSVAREGGEGSEPAAIRSGGEMTLRFRLESPDGKLVKDLDVVHEKILHLLMVSSDLAWFSHEHPELQTDGTFVLKTSFPHGGEFTLYHDFTPSGVGMQVVPVVLNVAGPAAAPAPLAVSRERKQTIDGFTFELSAASPIPSLQMQNLTFRATRDGKPVTDLEPFLGAMGHLIVVSEDRKRFVHSHPIEPPNGAPTRRGGPEVVFGALFPVPGLYKAWGQFQHQGKVLTVPFVVEVASPFAAAPLAGSLASAQGGAASAPARTARAAEWIADLDALAAELPKRHKNAFFHLPKGDFEARVAALRAHIPELTDPQILVELRRLVAALGDGHTTIVHWRLPATAPPIRELPFQAAWVADGIFASALPAQNAALLGQRIVHIGSAPIDAALAALAPLHPFENESSRKSQLSTLLREADTLAALGLAANAAAVELTLADPSGKETTIVLASYSKAGGASGAASRAASRPALTTKPDTSALPTWAKPQRFPFGQTLLADSKTLYIWYDTCQDQPNKKVKDFAAEALAAVDAGLAATPPAIDRVVVDLRRNGGGDNRLLDPLILGLRDREPLRAKGRLFALIGRGTYSSAMMNAIDLRKKAGALLVGEPTGGKPNTYGETQTFPLPNSKVLVQYSTKFFRDIDEDLDAILPDLVAAPNSESYFSGRDVALEAAIAYH